MLDADERRSDKLCKVCTFGGILITFLSVVVAEQKASSDRDDQDDDEPHDGGQGDDDRQRGVVLCVGTWDKIDRTEYAGNEVWSAWPARLY